MRLYFFLISLFLASTLYSQSSRGINIDFYYAPALTKTFLRNYDVLNFNLHLKELYDFQLPTRPSYGFSSGFIIQFPIKKKAELSIGINYSVKGQKSPKFLFTRYANVKDFETYYQFWIPSVEIPIGFHYELRHKKKFNYSIYGAISPDVYLIFKVRNFSKSEETGRWQKGCCYEHLLNYPENGKRIRSIIRHIKERLIRIGFISGIRGEYELLPHLSLFAQPELRFYTDIIREQYSTLTKGGAIVLNVKLGLSVNLKSNKK